MAGSLSYMQTSLRFIEIALLNFFLPSFLFFSFLFLFFGGGVGGGVRYGLRLNLDKLWLQRLVYALKHLLVILFFSPICFIFQLGLMIQSRGTFQRPLGLRHDHFTPIVDELDRMKREKARLKEEERVSREVRQMDLSYQGMPMTLPWQRLYKLSNFISLSKLDLSHNELHKTPGDIRWLPSLTHLFLNDNYLSSLRPEIIRRLVNLQELDVRNNKLNDFSLDITVLSCLQRLSVQGNPLRKDETRKLMMLAHEKRWIDIAGECKIL